MGTQAQAISQIRALIDDVDSPPSKSVRQENLRRSVLGDQVTATNKFFQLNNRRIVVNGTTSTLVVISDGATLMPATAYTEDDTRGTFTFAAGTAVPATSLLARYDFLHFLDAEILPFLTEGLRFVGYTDVTTVPDGLMKSVCAMAAAEAFDALAARNAPIYDASAGGKTLSKASIKKHWLDMKVQKMKDAVEALSGATGYYKRQGRRDAPAYGQTGTGQANYTPIR